MTTGRINQIATNTRDALLHAQRIIMVVQLHTTLPTVKKTRVPPLHLLPVFCHQSVPQCQKLTRSNSCYRVQPEGSTYCRYTSYFPRRDAVHLDRPMDPIKSHRTPPDSGTPWSPSAIPLPMTVVIERTISIFSKSSCPLI